MPSLQRRVASWTPTCSIGSPRTAMPSRCSRSFGEADRLAARGKARAKYEAPIAAADRRAGRDAEMPTASHYALCRTMPLVTTFTPKRALLASCFAMTAIFTLGAQPDYGDTIAGPSVNALIEAYESFGMGPDEKAPFLLEPYVVVIEQYGTSIRLTFDEHSTATPLSRSYH